MNVVGKSGRITVWDNPNSAMSEQAQKCVCGKLRETPDDEECPYCRRSYEHVGTVQLKHEGTFGEWCKAIVADMAKQGYEANIVERGNQVAVFRQLQ